MMNSINKIKANISDYSAYEFESELLPENIFEDGKTEPLAYTTLGDNEELEIQVTLDIERLLLITEVYPICNTTKEKNTVLKHFEYHTFENLKDIEEFTEFIDFDELISIEADYEDLFEIFGICNEINQ
jgi:hypothetical protein